MYNTNFGWGFENKFLPDSCTDIVDYFGSGWWGSDPGGLWGGDSGPDIWGHSVLSSPDIQPRGSPQNPADTDEAQVFYWWKAQVSTW